MTEPNQLTGVSTPPPDSTITVNDDSSVAVPNSNDSTIAQSAAPDQPVQSSPGQQDAQAKATPPPQPGQAPAQAQAPQSSDQTDSKQPDLSKGPSPIIPGAPAPAPANPAVKKASVFHDVAETLAGGPRYKYDVDAYGNMKKTPVPVSTGHLALAIAMEALSGLATGASEVGPGAAGRAASKAFQQQQQQVQQQDQQARQQAQEDFARRAQVTETNMRLYAQARNIGRQDEEATDKYIASVAPIVNRLQTELQGYTKEVVGYQNLSKYNATEQTALPIRRVPRLYTEGPNKGQQMTDASGNPRWDIDYLVIDPHFKVAGLFTPEIKKALAEQGMSWATGDEVDNTPLNAVTALNLISKATQWETAKTNFQNFGDTLSKAQGATQKEAQKGADSTSDLTIPGALDSPSLKNKAIDSIVAQAGRDYSGQVKDIISPENFTAVIRAMANQENDSTGKLISKAGARGPLQLMPKTAEGLGIKNIDDPKENVQGGARYFASLLKKYRTLPLALAAYNAGPGAVDKAGGIPKFDETQDYVKRITAALGYSEAAPEAATTEAVPENKFDLAAFTKIHPTMPAAIDQFNASLAHTDGSYSAALKDMESKGADGQQNSALISSFLGGADNIKQHDDYVATQAEIRKDAAKNEGKLAYDAAKKKAEEQGILDRNQTLIDALAAGKPIDLSRIATMRAYDREIITNEVLRRNPEYNPASIDRAVDLMHEMADESKTGSIGNSIANVNTAYGHMGEAVEHITNMQNRLGRNFSDYTNKPMSWMNDHFGNDPEYQQWKVALNAAATDWQNLLNNQHALTDHDKEVAATVANPNATFGNAMASLQEMARTAAVRTVPLNERVRQTLGVNHQNLIQPQTIAALKRINDPVTNKYLENLESGGSLAGGTNGVGTPGRRVGDLLGMQQTQQQQQQQQPNANQQQKMIPGQRPGEIPKYVNGKLVGFTKPGAKGMRPAQQQQPQQ